MMNRNRTTHDFPTFHASSAVSGDRKFSCLNPSPPPVCPDTSDIEMGFRARPVFGDVSVAANAVTKLTVMRSGALFVIPRDSLKNIPAVAACMANVFSYTHPLLRRLFPLIGWRKTQAPFVSYSVTSVIISVLRRVSTMTLLRAKLGSFHAVIRDAVFRSARGAFECGHAEKVACPLDLSRQYLGSGSHAIACHYAGLHLIACELDEDYYKAACERIERETKQMSFL